MTDTELNELFTRVMAKADRDTILLVGELHKRLTDRIQRSSEDYTEQDQWPFGN